MASNIRHHRRDCFSLEAFTARSICVVCCVFSMGVFVAANSRAAAKTGLDLAQSDQLALIRRYVPKFANRTLVVSVIVREPFVIYDEPPGLANATQRERQLAQRDWNNYSGVAIEVVKRLQSIFKFKIQIKQPKEQQFGVYQEGRRQWTGLMGELARREVDIGVTALSITVSRASAIDFTRAYFVETVAILLRRPEEVENYFAIFKPFSATVWFVLLGSIMLLIALVTLMTKLEDKQLKQEERAHELQLGLVRLARQSGGQSHPLASRRRGRLSKMLVRSASHLPHGHSPADQQPFGSSWLERFYYAVTCVINILLIRGE